MAASCQIIDKKIEDNLNTQTRENGIKKNTVSTNTPRRPSPKAQRFQEITKKIISASSSRSSIDAHRNAPHSPMTSTTARSTHSITTGESRRKSLAAVVACSADDVSSLHSQHTTSSRRASASNGKLNGFSHPTSTISNKSKYGSSHPTRSSGQSASSKLANTSSEMRETQESARNSKAETHAKSRAGAMDGASRNRSNELCKDCKASIMESVCFIANDGRISAVTAGAAFTRNYHHCNVQGCAANQRYNPSPLPLSRKALLSKRWTRCGDQSTGTNAHTMSGVGDHNSICSSATSSMQGDDRCIPQGKQELNQIGLGAVSPCRDTLEPLSTHAAKDQKSYRENSHAESAEARSTAPVSCISSELHDDDDDDDDDDDNTNVFGNRDAIKELNDFKSLLYHGDNEYSCSEDGTELTTTPMSSIKGAFDDLSNIDIEQFGCANKATQWRRSTKARMRKKYLESLREQEAETVRLRKQEIMARKQAGDWMLDCHMEEVLHRLAPNGEARVKVLVKAYETVIHHSDSDSSQTHHQDHHFHEQERVDNLAHRYASS